MSLRQVKLVKCTYLHTVPITKSARKSSQQIHECHLERPDKRYSRWRRLFQEVTTIVVLEEAKAVHNSEGSVVN